MRSILQLAFVFCLATGLSQAGNWTGALVDSQCYARILSNTSHDATHAGADRKRSIRTCAAKEKTKSFAIVQHDGSTLDLDPGGHENTIQELLKSGKAPHMVNVNGEIQNNTIKVAGISRSK